MRIPLIEKDFLFYSQFRRQVQMKYDKSYSDDPELVHSGQMVIVLKSSQNLSPLRMISLSRTATQVSKYLLAQSYCSTTTGLTVITEAR